MNLDIICMLVNGTDRATHADGATVDGYVDQHRMAKQSGLFSTTPPDLLSTNLSDFCSEPI